MKYNRLGKTDLRVSEISFGAIPIMKGDVDILTKYANLELEEAADVLTYAENSGINFFDTALIPEYGDSEIKVGHAFKENREDVIIASKARAFTSKDMEIAVEKSLRNLDMKYIDIYFIHQLQPKTIDISFEGRGGAIGALKKLKKEEKIGFIGVGTHHATVLEKCIECEDIDVLLLPLNVIESGIAERIVEKARERDVGLVAMKLFGGGVLQDYFPVEMLLNFPFQYDIDTALVGMHSKQQIDQNIKLLKEDVDEKELERLRIQLFGGNYCNRCQICSCPLGTDISKFLRYGAYFFKYGLKEWANVRYSEKIKKGDFKCDLCGVCEKQCPRNLPIRKMFEGLENILHLSLCQINGT